jgi:hypothetical protein
MDRGYVTVTPDYRLEVSRRIRDEFENGRDYYALHGREARVPRRLRRAPRADPGGLAQHAQVRGMSAAASEDLDQRVRLAAFEFLECGVG